MDVCLGNPPYSHLELGGMKENWKPEATKNISVASTPGQDLYLLGSSGLQLCLLEEKQPEPGAT